MGFVDERLLVDKTKMEFFLPLQLTLREYRFVPFTPMAKQFTAGPDDLELTLSGSVTCKDNMEV